MRVYTVSELRSMIYGLKSNREFKIENGELILNIPVVKPKGRRASSINKINLEGARILRAEGRTYEYIASIYGCSRQAVEQMLNYHKEEDFLTP